MSASLDPPFQGAFSIVPDSVIEEILSFLDCASLVCFERTCNGFLRHFYLGLVWAKLTRRQFKFLDLPSGPTTRTARAWHRRLVCRQGALLVAGGQNCSSRHRDSVVPELIALHLSGASSEDAKESSQPPSAAPSFLSPPSPSSSSSSSSSIALSSSPSSSSSSSFSSSSSSSSSSTYEDDDEPPPLIPAAEAARAAAPPSAASAAGTKRPRSPDSPVSPSSQQGPQPLRPSASSGEPATQAPAGCFAEKLADLMRRFPDTDPGALLQVASATSWDQSGLLLRELTADLAEAGVGACAEDGEEGKDDEKRRRTGAARREGEEREGEEDEEGDSWEEYEDDEYYEGDEIDIERGPLDRTGSLTSWCHLASTYENEYTATALARDDCARVFFLGGLHAASDTVSSRVEYAWLNGCKDGQRGLRMAEEKAPNMLTPRCFLQSSYLRSSATLLAIGGCSGLFQDATVFNSLEFLRLAQPQAASAVLVPESVQDEEKEEEEEEEEEGEDGADEDGDGDEKGPAADWKKRRRKARQVDTEEDKKKTGFTARHRGRTLPVDCKWQTGLPAMLHRRGGHVSQVSPFDGRLYALGGFAGDMIYNSSLECLDLASFSSASSESAVAWQELAPMREPRTGFAGGFGPDQCLLVAGGSPDGMYSSDSCEKYDPRSNIWTRCKDMPVCLGYTSGTFASDGLFYVCGGQRVGIPGGATPFCLVYDPRADAWMSAPILPTTRIDLSCCFIDCPDELCCDLGLPTARSVC